MAVQDPANAASLRIARHTARTDLPPAPAPRPTLTFPRCACPARSGSRAETGGGGAPRRHPAAVHARAFALTAPPAMRIPITSAGHGGSRQTPVRSLRDHFSCPVRPVAQSPHREGPYALRAAPALKDPSSEQRMSMCARGPHRHRLAAVRKGIRMIVTWPSRRREPMIIVRPSAAREQVTYSDVYPAVRPPCMRDFLSA